MSLNFNLKNMISTYICKGFCMEEMAQIRQISKHKKKVFGLPDFNDKFQKVAKNIEGFFNF
jgi:hypothetical protein